MTSVIKYGGFVAALGLAVALGYWFSERNHRINVEHIALPIEVADEAKADSDAEKRLAVASAVEAKAVIEQQAAAKLMIGQAAKTAAAQAESKRKEDKQFDRDKKIVAGAARPIEVASEANSEAATATYSETRLVQFVLSEAMASDLNMLEILAPLKKVADGQPLGSDAIASKVLLVAVWASWCSSCQRDIPNLARLQRKLDNSNLEVVVLAAEESVEEVQRAVKPHPIHHPFVMLDRSASEKLQLNAMPSLYLVDSLGKLRGKFNGYTAEYIASYENSVVALLSETKINQEKLAQISSLTDSE